MTATKTIAQLREQNAELLAALKLAREYITDDCGARITLPEVEEAIKKAEAK